MTTTSADPTTAPAGDDLARAAADAAAAVLPASEPLSALDPQPATEAVTALFAGAAVTELVGGSGRIAILVGQELVDALAGSPLGGLDLDAAVQPALDAAAVALGASARAARTVPLELVLGDLGAPLTAVPLAGSTIVGALLVPEQVLTPAPEPTAPFAQELPTEPPAPIGTRVTAAVSVPAPRDGLGIEMLHGVEMEITVELGRTRMPVRELLALAPGTVLELDRAAGSAADLLVNGRLIARGEVVVVDEDFGLRVTEILDESVG
ncbi:MAG TPA: flagellar motor switch protein FliN [Nocardioides sp.]|nr:flagellar motor switch protein FliN [Nocardioides sp.]